MRPYQRQVSGSNQPARAVAEVPHIRPGHGRLPGMTEITGVLLAAGFSTRFGAAKLLQKIEGRPMIAYSATALAPCDRIVAVVREDDNALQSIFQSLGVECLLNPEPARGLGYSIACAVNATPLTPQHGGWCLLPADMPRVSASTTLQLVKALRAGASLAAPFYRGRRGHPVVFDTGFRSDLSALDGETGARVILQRHTGQLTEIHADDAGVLADIDTRADLYAARTAIRRDRVQ